MRKYRCGHRYYRCYFRCKKSGEPGESSTQKNKRNELRNFPPEVASGSTARAAGTSGGPVLPVLHPVQISGELKVPVPGKISGSGIGIGHRKCPAVVPVLVPVLPATEEHQNLKLDNFYVETPNRVNPILLERGRQELPYKKKKY